MDVAGCRRATTTTRAGIPSRWRSCATCSHGSSGAQHSALDGCFKAGPSLTLHFEPCSDAAFQAGLL